MRAWASTDTAWCPIGARPSRSPCVAPGPATRSFWRERGTRTTRSSEPRRGRSTIGWRPAAPSRRSRVERALHGRAGRLDRGSADRRARRALQGCFHGFANAGKARALRGAARADLRRQRLRRPGGAGRRGGRAGAPRRAREGETAGGARRALDRARHRTCAGQSRRRVATPADRARARLHYRVHRKDQHEGADRGGARGRGSHAEDRRQPQQRGWSSTHVAAPVGAAPVRRHRMRDEPPRRDRAARAMVRSGRRAGHQHHPRTPRGMRVDRGRRPRQGRALPCAARHRHRRGERGRRPRARAGQAVAAQAGDLRRCVRQRRPPDLRPSRRPRPARRAGVRRRAEDGGAEADRHAQWLQRRRGGSSGRGPRARRGDHPARARECHHAGPADAPGADAQRRAAHRRLLQRESRQHQGGAAHAHPPGARKGTGHRRPRRHAGARPHRARSAPRRRAIRRGRGALAAGLFRGACQGPRRRSAGGGAEGGVHRVQRGSRGSRAPGAGAGPARGRGAGQGIARDEDGARERRARRGNRLRRRGTEGESDGRDVMLYNLLFPFSDRVPLFNVLRYPSFRMLMAGLVSLMIGLFLGPSYIDALRRLQHGASSVREDTPEAHQLEIGTPSMGGGLILWAMLGGTLLFAHLTNRPVWAALIITLGFGAIGFADDWLKFSKRNSKGLAGRKKLLWQTIIFVVVVAVFFVDWKHGSLYLDTRLAIPFVKVKAFNPVLPWWIYLPFAFVVIVGTSNAVNLTDGLDGLAIGPTIVSALTFLLLAYLAGATIRGLNIADYLLIPHIPGAAELAVVFAAIAGAGISFLWFNTYPASVFMGDVGSLAPGGGRGAPPGLTKNEVGSAGIPGGFFSQLLSVMAQVFWFKRTGRRIFRMAPIHHHFELKGWAEPKIIVRFWIVSIILALTALASLKLR